MEIQREVIEATYIDNSSKFTTFTRCKILIDENGIRINLGRNKINSANIKTFRVEKLGLGDTSVRLYVKTARKEFNFRNIAAESFELLKVFNVEQKTRRKKVEKKPEITEEVIITEDKTKTLKQIATQKIDNDLVRKQIQMEILYPRKKEM